ncbi:TPA: hypothetical protein PL572_001565 [Cronobacter turicensis]|nr:hypothetical protein [Cronobacter turicensis]
MKILFALLITLLSFTSQANDFCSKLSTKADDERAIIQSSESGYKTSGKGRVYFYSAPSEKCRIKNTFIIPGDLVNAYADFGDYTYIMYFTKDGKDVEGWVRTDRLVETGTGIGPSEEKKGE